ncbi:MAG: hypothetical protein ACO1NX_08400 [Chitinophagaceae bacterium]
MARIFSVSFMHKGIAHNAMIGVRTTPFFTEYSIHVFDEWLATLLPNNKVIATPENNFTFSDSTSANDLQLMDDLLKAIAEHVHTLHA